MAQRRVHDDNNPRFSRGDIGSSLHRRSIHSPVLDSDSDVDLEIPQVHARSSVSLNPYGNSTSSLPTSSDHESKYDILHSGSITSVPSLLDITAELVGRTCTCDKLEHRNPPLDEALLKKVAFWAFPTDESKVKAYTHLSDLYRTWAGGKNLVKNNKIIGMWQVGFMAVAHIANCSVEEKSDTGDIHVSLTFEQQRILSSICSQCKMDTWCAHVVAAVVYRIQFPDQVRVYAPMTETLSTLNRDQLQKLLQYAVTEDPTGILGRVFKHIDAVRNNNYDMEHNMSIPDPTFGGLEFSTAEWQMSLSIFEEHLKKHLTTLTNNEIKPDMYSYYPASFDKIKKKRSYLYWFNQRVIELIRTREYRSAAKVLITLLRNVAKQMIDQPFHKSVKQYFHDLCRFYAIVMVYLQDKEHGTWQLLCGTAEGLDSSMALPARYKMKTSRWAELPCLASIFPHLEEDTLFCEPIAACRIQPDFELFQKMFSHQPTSIECCHIEDIHIIFAQLEGYTKFGEHSSIRPQNICNVLLHLLIHLCKYAKKYSIIGNYISQLIQHHNSEREMAQRVCLPFDIIHASRKQPEDSPQSSFTRIKTKKKRRPDPSVAVPVERKKKKKTASAPDQRNCRQGACSSKGKLSARSIGHQQNSLTKGQLLYSITYCCYVIVNIETKTDIQFAPKELLLGYTVLALELGYFRTCASENEISLSEHGWLDFLEKYLGSYLQENINAFPRVVHTYMDAFNKVGFDFYNGVYPLVLMNTLCYKMAASSDLRERCCPDLVTLLSMLLRDLPSHHNKYTLSTSNKMSHSDTDCDKTDYAWKDFLTEKIHSLMSIFLSLIQQGNSHHEDLVTEVLHVLKKCDAITKENDLVKDVIVKLCGMRCSKKLLHTLTEFAFHAYKSCTSDRVAKISMLRELLFSLCAKIGVSSLNLIPENWAHTVPLTDVHDVIFMFESDIRQLDKPPEKVVDLIMEVLGNHPQCTNEICELLSLFTFGNVSYTKAVDNILKNSSSYEPSILLVVAKEIWEKKGSEACKQHDSQCLRLIKAALDQLKHYGLSHEYIDWLCSVATADQNTTDNIPYQVIISHLAQSCHQHPDILLHVLDNMKRRGVTWLKHADQVANALIPAYAEYFCSKLHDRSHRNYGTIISSMQKAKLDCVCYVKNGGSLFDEKVVSQVCQVHQNKKKFISMLHKEFHESK